MTVFTYSQARQNLSKLLNLANQEGEVLIKRRDGHIFRVKSEWSTKSPLDVKGIKSDISTSEIIQSIRESRERQKLD